MQVLQSILVSPEYLATEGEIKENGMHFLNMCDNNLKRMFDRRGFNTCTNNNTSEVMRHKELVNKELRLHNMSTSCRLH